MDEAFRLPVRAWRIGSRVEVTQPETCATLLEHARAVSPAVVGHHPGDVDAEVAEGGDGGTNENTNGSLRQYCPKGTDLSRHSRDELEAVASALNSRPRKTLGWKTPAEALDDYLCLIRE